jgi:NADH-quinone oxidoreductase subunit G
MSVWYLKEQYSVCPGCANGCNIRIQYNLDRRYKVQGRRVMRLKPRFNEQVNKWWMCDEGRYNYRWIDLDRIEEPAVKEADGLRPVDWKTITTMVASEIRQTIDQYGPDSIAVIASAGMTNEELYLLRKLFFEELKISALYFYIPPDPNASEDNFLIKKDKNPNTKGAELILSERKAASVSAVLDAAKSGRLKLLYIIHSNLIKHFGLDSTRAALNEVPTVIYQGTNRLEMMDFAKYILPAATYAETEGSFTNFQGRVQRIFPAVAPLLESKPSVNIFKELGDALGKELSSDPATIFRQMAAQIPEFIGMDYNTIGLSGRLITTTPQPALAAD